MPQKSKYTIEQKIKACEDYLSGTRSASQILFDLKMSPRNYMTLYKWVDKYTVWGMEAFTPRLKNQSYSKEFKLQAIKEYLSGHYSIREIVTKYNIGSKSVLERWIKSYNANRELRDYCPNREVYMAEARRKTTIEERKEIVEYCISHNRNYKETASIYDVSYSQVYTWVKKYDEKGDDGLIDKRGIHKKDEELDELERLRRENKRLKRKLEEEYMLVELLKKVREFEGM